MIESIHAFLGTAAALVFWELVKLFGLTLFKSEAPKAVARGLQILDEMMPGLIEEGISGSQAEAALRGRLGSLTGQEWADIRRRYDPVAALDKIAHLGPPSQ